MFTGLIEEVGTIAGIVPGGKSLRVEIACEKVADGAAKGDSIAVDGVCLTVEELPLGRLVFYASPETMAKTALGDRKAGDRVNLERALTLSTRLGGHLVSGHVDATGTFSGALLYDGAWEVRIAAPPEILRLCIPKGSITVDGISLTLVEVTERGFSLWIIPETWKRTTLSMRKPGDRVNLETDLIGKYIEKLLTQGIGAPAPRGASDETLSGLLAKGGWGTR